MDGVDGVLVDFAEPAPRVVSHASAPFPEHLKSTFMELNTSGADELHRAALAGNALARLYAEVVDALLLGSNYTRAAVKAVGAHGQTVRHQPGRFDGTGYTLQLNQPALLAELCGIDVVADFRSRDVAAGGQGAPLVPPFHQALFGHLPGTTGVLNIGGIANITLLNATEPGSVSGFDCGPGNALMDAWCLAHTGAPYDDGGAWAAGGTVHAALLKALLDDAFFAKAPPKSTGRDLFNTPWLQAHLRTWPGIAAQDIQATLTELTTRACAQSVLQHAPGCAQLLVCGGGALNDQLMLRLQAHLKDCHVSSTATFGVLPVQVEAIAFAWLARQCCKRDPASLPGVTGAKGPRVLGAIYAAG